MSTRQKLRARFVCFENEFDISMNIRRYTQLKTLGFDRDDSCMHSLQLCLK